VRVNWLQHNQKQGKKNHIKPYSNGERQGGGVTQGTPFSEGQQKKAGKARQKEV